MVSAPDSFVLSKYHKPDFAGWYELVEIKVDVSYFFSFFAIYGK